MEEYVATIGMFDGVHLGHQFVLRQVVEQALHSGLHSLCITFDHPFKQDNVLTPLDEKLQLIKETGIERVEVLSFTPELKALTAREFMEQELRDRLHVSILMTGYDNRFGHNREECFDDYVRYGQELGIEVIGLPPAPTEGEGILASSSMVRKLLGEGKVNEAALLLGHAYRLTGHVTHGEHIGTTLGFPTANIIPNDPRQVVPANGVYAVRCATFNGMMNIGTRPTFGTHPQTLEVHLLHYQGDLYQQQLTIEFVSRLREERSFDTPEALIEQLKKDAIEAQKQL